MLKVNDVCSGYGTVEILHGVSIRIGSDELVTIIGPNGAGKSTLLKTIMGYLIPTKGTIYFNKEEVTNLKPEEKITKGIGYVPQLDNIFPPLTIKENLEMGGFTLNPRRLDQKIKDVYEIFPVLARRENIKAHVLSGGQRQMLALGRALMTNPDLLLLDEPSAGLDPNTTQTVLNNIKKIQDQGTSITIVEQNARQSLNISHRAYVLDGGQNRYQGEAHEILQSETIRKTYLSG